MPRFGEKFNKFLEEEDMEEEDKELNLNSKERTTEERAGQILEHSMQNEDKVAAREILLEEHPELKIHVDTKKLREIIDYLEFKCHPKSSIARDKAVKESDIDAGLVISKEDAGRQKELTFIEELRRQGFKAYHSSEYEETKRKAKLPNLPWQQRSELIKEMVEKESAVIQFYTKEALEELKEKSGFLSKEVLIFLAGRNIA